MPVGKILVFFCVIFYWVTVVGAPTDLSAIKIHPRPGTVALTFDDGPNPKYTPEILAILDRYHIKATFFVMGIQAKRYPNLVRDIQAHGHVIANHSMTHPFLTKLSDQQLKYQVDGTNGIVKQITGRAPLCLRPPYGLSNARVRNYIHSQGMQVVMWDLNSFDYEHQPVSHLINWVLTKTKPGYDLLMHDGSGNSFQTVKALPAIIEGLQQRGMGFDVICQ